MWVPRKMTCFRHTHHSALTHHALPQLMRRGSHLRDSLHTWNLDTCYWAARSRHPNTSPAPGLCRFPSEFLLDPFLFRCFPHHQSLPVWFPRKVVGSIVGCETPLAHGAVPFSTRLPSARAGGGVERWRYGQAGRGCSGSGSRAGERSVRWRWLGRDRAGGAGYRGRDGIRIGLLSGRGSARAGIHFRRVLWVPGILLLVKWESTPGECRLQI